MWFGAHIIRVSVVKKAVIFLFNDILIVATPKRSKKLLGKEEKFVAKAHISIGDVLVWDVNESGTSSTYARAKQSTETHLCNVGQHAFSIVTSRSSRGPAKSQQTGNITVYVPSREEKEAWMEAVACSLVYHLLL